MIDRYDYFDNFSGKNPDCSIVNNHAYCQDDAPIALWNREEYFGCNNNGGVYNCSEYSTMTEGDINAVASHIDEYIHYWADQTGGKAQKHWLTIVGDDQVIPFYRAQDPTNSTQGDSWAYNASDHTEAMAEQNWIFTENLYQDTDGNGWGIGEVDRMYVGRIVADNVDNLFTIIDSNLNSLFDSDNIDATHFTMTSGKGKDCSEDDLFRETMLEAESYFTGVDYDIVCQDNGTCSSDCKDGDWLNGCLLGSEQNETTTIDYWIDFGLFSLPHYIHTCNLTGTIWDFNDLSINDVIAFNDHGLPRSTNNFRGYALGSYYRYILYLL